MRIIHHAFLSCLIATAVSTANTSLADEPAPLQPDMTVSLDGKADFTSIQAAIDSLPQPNTQRVVILVQDGIYQGRIKIDRDRVTLRGQSRDGVQLLFDLSNGEYEANRGKYETEGQREIGRAVINIDSDDVVIENLTAANTFQQIGPHAFTVYGKGTRTVILNSNLLSNGADTVSLWDSRTGMYYHADCFFMGSVDYVCPRGWCYITDSRFRQLGGSAGLWHAGGEDEDQKFVIRNSSIDGYPGFTLARHHYDAQFYFIDCNLSANMSDKPIFRKTYPDNPQRDRPNNWGDRRYFSNTHRDGGDPPWLRDNLETAKGSPAPSEVTPAWTFGGQWDPESAAAPKVESITRDGDRILIRFAEDVCVRGEPTLVLTNGGRAAYAEGSGGHTLVFQADGGGDVASLDASQGRIIAAVASRWPRAVTTLP